MNLTHKKTTPDNSKFCGEEISSGCQDDRWGPNPIFCSQFHEAACLNRTPLARIDVEPRGPSQNLSVVTQSCIQIHVCVSVCVCICITVHRSNGVRYCVPSYMFCSDVAGFPGLSGTCIVTFKTFCYLGHIDHCFIASRTFNLGFKACWQSLCLIAADSGYQ